MKLTRRNGPECQGAEDVAVTTPYRSNVKESGNQQSFVPETTGHRPRWSGSHVGPATQKKEVIVIGAGPYGLSATAHLLAAGVVPYVIGDPMGFWKQNMPKGMFLRSRAEASNIAAPQKHLSIESYQKVLGRKFPDPLPIEDFVSYGEWFQKQVAPNLDRRRVQNVSKNGNGFAVTFEDGEKIYGESVVLALGIGPFLHRPEQFLGIPTELAPHSSTLTDLSQFRGKRVAVLGKGQSALEYAEFFTKTKPTWRSSRAPRRSNFVRLPGASTFSGSLCQDHCGRSPTASCPPPIWEISIRRERWRIPRSSDVSLWKFRNRCCETAPSPSAPIGCLPGLRVFR